MKKIPPVVLILILPVVIVAAVIIFASTQQADDTTDSSEVSQTEQSQPPLQPPGAAVDPAELGPPTVVAEGMSPEEHVKAYFDAYQEGRLEEAFALAPAENKVTQPKDEFISTRQGMPITEYNMSAARDEGSSTMVDVEYDLGASMGGSWISSWTFEKQDDKWVAVRYKASMGTLN